MKEIKEYEAEVRRRIDEKTDKIKRTRRALGVVLPLMLCVVIVTVAALPAMTGRAGKTGKRNAPSVENRPETGESVLTEQDSPQIPSESLNVSQFGSAKVSGFASFNSNVFSDNIPALFEKSDAVILGTVVRDSEANVSEHGVTYPLTDVEVERVWKGDLAAGDVITFSQTGERTDKGYDLSIGGEPLGKNGDRMILFLFSNDVNDLYGVTGCFQGKFFVGDDDNVYAYEYFSEEYAEWYFSDVGAVTPFDEFVSILDSAK